MSSHNMTIEEFGRFRREYSRRHKEKQDRIPFISKDKWLTLAMEGTLKGQPLSDTDILIAFCGISMPSVGNYWTGMLVVDPVKRGGYVWINEIVGELPVESKASVYSGDQAIGRDHLGELLELLDQVEIQEFHRVPARCYDGCPVDMKLRLRKIDKVIETSANAADDGVENTLKLAKIIASIASEVRLTKVFSE